MRRRGIPPIAPSDLQDLATPERIERVWERVEADLPSPDVVSASPNRVIVGVLAAVVASLASGLLLGKLIWAEPGGAVDVAVAPVIPTAAAPSEADVFAAGTQGRVFPLPGGGELVLSPGSTVEVVREDGNTLELRLVQGEAAIDTSGAPPRRMVALVAGDARLSTETGGAMRVKRNDSDLDVSVTGGRVDLSSPTESRRLGKGDRAESVPLRRARTASRLLPPPPRSSANPVAVAEAPPLEAPTSAPVLSDWRARYRVGDTQNALRLLRESPGGVDGAIQSAPDADTLMEIHDVVVREDLGAAMKALMRVVTAFPGDASEQIAAYKLGQYYDRMHQADTARAWYARAKTLDGVLAEDALCNQFRASPNKEEAVRAAQEYVAKYPNGRCMEEAQRVIAGEPIEPAEDQPADDEPDAATK